MSKVGHKSRQLNWVLGLSQREKNGGFSRAAIWVTGTIINWSFKQDSPMSVSQFFECRFGFAESESSPYFF